MPLNRVAHGFAYDQTHPRTGHFAGPRVGTMDMENQIPLRKSGAPLHGLPEFG